MIHLRMKATSALVTILSCISFAIFPGKRLSAQSVPGIPEPGLLLYGAVTNSNGGTPWSEGSVRWTVSGGGSTALVDSTMVNVNGQYFYLARMPFETRSAGGVNFTATPNVLPLTDVAAAFTRSATVSGTAATIIPPATSAFSFAKSDRGRVERVNLAASLAPDPALDTDGDGMPDWMELIAGTNPNDPHSVLKLSSDVEPSLNGGLTLTWASVNGKTYRVSHTFDLGQSFTALSGDIPSGGATTSFTDATATGPGPYFYRISVVP